VLDLPNASLLNGHAVERAKRMYRARAVERAFDVLSVLGERPDGATLADLTRATGVSGSTLLGILGSLRERTIVREDGKRYALDVGVLQLGQAYFEGADLAGLFFPIGRRLCAALDETVQLGVLSGASAVYLARHESTQPVRFVGEVGRRRPAHASAAGKALLAEMADADIVALLGHEPFARVAEKTITTYDALRRALETIRRKGFAESREECIPGLHCVSAPVVDRSGSAVAAITVSVPCFRMGRARRDGIAAEVIGAAGEMSQALGADGNRISLVHATGDQVPARAAR
jgi:IclR family acetate operon transcriptional repressor